MKYFSRICVVTSSIFGLSGCATIINGTHQDIEVNTNPAGAMCSITRQDADGPIGQVASTPGKVSIEKTKYFITITCDKPGYETTTFRVDSGVNATAFGDIVLSGGVGWAVDSATGSDNKYDSPVNITLLPKAAQIPAGTK